MPIKSVVILILMLLTAAFVYRPANYPLTLHPDRARYVITGKKEETSVGINPLVWRQQNVTAYLLALRDTVTGMESEQRVQKHDWDLVKVGEGWNGDME